MTRVKIATGLILITTGMLAQNVASEEAAIRKFWQRFEEAFNSYDAEKVSSLYATDGDRINADMEIARGRTEVAAQYQKELAKRRADTSTVPLPATVAIRLLDSQVAIVDGEWEGFMAGKRVRGQFTAILKKGAEDWQIAAGRIRGLKEL
jgi:uncharacterized protein (TIGR02246 family)